MEREIESKETWWDQEDGIGKGKTREGFGWETKATRGRSYDKWETQDHERRIWREARRNGRDREKVKSYPIARGDFKKAVRTRGSRQTTDRRKKSWKVHGG